MRKGLRETNKTKLSFSWGAITDIGRVREENQDAYFADPDTGLFLVSDGMGGHQAGALASKVVSEVFPVMVKEKLGKLKSHGTAAMKSMLKKTIVELSRQTRIQSSNQTGLMGMGATLVMALLRGNQAFIANMGDSRAYLCRKGQLSQISEEHSVVGILLRTKEITPQEARYHPARGQLTRFIGMLDEVYPYVCTVTLKPKDRILLCSDGLTGMVEDKEIVKLLQENKNPQDACKMLVDKANAAGGHDNITVVVVDL
jgi:protein phosphatase